MYYSRTLEHYLNQIDRQFPVILLTGPRQVGKTTLLRHLRPKLLTYVTLDDPKLAQLAREEPELFLQRFKTPLLIDEIQYAPELLPFIKIAVDKERRAGDFWLTGSQQFHLMKGVSESLAGRIGVINLLGLSLKEQQQEPFVRPFIPTLDELNLRAGISKSISLIELYDFIWHGSFPMMCTSSIDWNLFYSSYVQTYLQRDVRDLANIGDIHTFLKFLRAAAARTGQLLNISEIARDTGVNPSTAKSWLSILEASGIIYFLEPYYNNLTKRLVKTPKLYFLDTGLCAFLTEWSSAATLEAGAMSGAILETFIMTEMIKSYWHNGRQAPFYFYRDKDQKEIDLLIIQNDTIYPIEFKKTARPDKSIVHTFDVLHRFKKPLGPGGVMCLTDMLLPITSQYNAIPVSLL